MRKMMTLRPATLQDVKLLFKWRNDPETRRASHNQEKVGWKEHFSWVARVIDDPNRKLYIAEEDNDPVGSARADLSEGIWELSWTVAPDARGRGVAKRMVAMLANRIAEPIRAEIKAGNMASVRIAEHAGLEFEKEADGVLHYRRAALR